MRCCAGGRVGCSPSCFEGGERLRATALLLGLGRVLGGGLGFPGLSQHPPVPQTHTLGSPALRWPSSGDARWSTMAPSAGLWASLLWGPHFTAAEHPLPAATAAACPTSGRSVAGGTAASVTLPRRRVTLRDSQRTLGTVSPASTAARPPLALPSLAGMAEGGGGLPCRRAVGTHPLAAPPQDVGRQLCCIGCVSPPAPVSPTPPSQVTQGRGFAVSRSCLASPQGAVQVERGPPCRTPGGVVADPISAAPPSPGVGGSWALGRHRHELTPLVASSRPQRREARAAKHRAERRWPGDNRRPHHQCWGCGQADQVANSHPDPSLDRGPRHHPRVDTRRCCGEHNP